MRWSLPSQRPEQALGEEQGSSDAQEEMGGGAAFSVWQQSTKLTNLRLRPSLRGLDGRCWELRSRQGEEARLLSASISM